MACRTSFIGRHPFPGPGLAIRCPGGITREKLEILREADAIYLDEIRKAGLYDAIWQAFAVLLPVQTVGVMGDGRTYEFVCALRAVTSVDGMTADFYHYDMEFLGRPQRASSMKSRASTASSTTSRPSRPARSSGSEGEYRGVVSDSRGHSSESLSNAHPYAVRPTPTFATLWPSNIRSRAAREVSARDQFSASITRS